MISIGFDDQGKIGLQYVLERLHPCSPFGAERMRKLRFFAPDARDALEAELMNTERAALACDTLGPLYEKIMLSLCQLKDVRVSGCPIARCSTMWSCLRSRGSCFGSPISFRCSTA